jgi:hypothetical protein
MADDEQQRQEVKIINVLLSAGRFNSGLGTPDLAEIWRYCLRLRVTLCWREPDSNHRFLGEFRRDVGSPWRGGSGLPSTMTIAPSSPRAPS